MTDDRSPRSTPLSRAAARRGAAVVVALLALAGLGLSVRLLATTPASAAPARFGVPVPTEFGTVTLTRAGVAFVPATQGPPTMATMNGSQGSDQLQVWVRLTNTDAPQGWDYAAGQFSVVDTEGHRHRPDGSTLGQAVLPAGSAVDGQVWFALDGSPRPTPAWLEFRSGDGTARFALPHRATGSPQENGHEHQH